MNDPEYSQCYTCIWDYLTYYLDFRREEMIWIEGNPYCPLCNPMLDNEDRIIAENRKELGRVYHMLEDNPTPEQIEQELLKERREIITMSQEELEQHIDELDKLYKQLQTEAAKVKRKTIAGLELKREKYGTSRTKIQKPKVAKGEDDQIDRVAELLASLSKGKGSSLKESE